MRLDFIPLDKLCVSKANMRFAKRAPDVTDILPTVRARGVLTPVIVRPNCAPGSFEVVAGSRRFHAAQIVAAEHVAAGAQPEPMPCAILDEADDAAAIEASLIENVARRDASEVQQWETFTRLVREGRSLDDIGLTFGLPELTVKRILALGNLLPRIRALYAAEDIDRATARHLTLGTKRQQQEWLKLYDDPDCYPPRGHNLKAWLLGGASIKVEHALFDLEGSGLAIVADLFGEEACFADAAAFWVAQDAAVEALRAGFVEAGWSDAVIVGPDEHYQSWEYEKAPKRKGGRVYIDVRSSGEVVCHEGYVSRREAQRASRGGDGASTDTKPARPEVTSGLQTYIDLHRHAAVRADLTAHPGIALRLMVAHVVIGSSLFRVAAEPQATRDDDIRQSVHESPGEALFDDRRRAVLGLLGASPDDPLVIGGNGDEVALVALFERLLDLPDPALMDVIAIAMGESLAAGNAAVDAVAIRIGTDMADWWEADPMFFGLVRDKQVLGAMVAEVAGESVASANAKEKGAVLKKIVADHLAGAEGRTKIERWVPRWLAFPPAAYTERGGVGSVRAHRRAEAGIEQAAAAGREVDVQTGVEAEAPEPAAVMRAAGSDDGANDGPAGQEESERLAA